MRRLRHLIAIPLAFLVTLLISKVALSAFWPGSTLSSTVWSVVIGLASAVATAAATAATTAKPVPPSSAAPEDRATYHVSATDSSIAIGQNSGSIVFNAERRARRD
ncbi:hypothetical protein O3597_16665 [Verrucosispora sp. WMMA2044]|uniref:hypothetical protein n=1 Tax=Verrucosispora sp. WMMA2044 TaxID=3016419 RepID=UPI00248CD8B7|nr:hypothetical protein [Verrucosispora sp. WMMA2044]WBB46817.1 hypothetical protein O3597_16665 [Verrucosispora sp. WMMA2044]